MSSARREVDHAGLPDLSALASMEGLARRAGTRAMLVPQLQLAACSGGSEAAPFSPAPPAIQPVAADPDPPTPPVAAGPAPAGNQLVWADEFDMAGLPDATRWA